MGPDSHSSHKLQKRTQPRGSPCRCEGDACELHGIMRLDVARRHQFDPNVSPPAGVSAAAQVVGSIDAARLRTLPSPRPTCITLWGVEATPRSHLPPFAAVAVGFAGWTWKSELVPWSQTMPPPRPPP